MENKNFYSIQALRALAAVLVMCFHFREDINKSVAGLGDRLFLKGDIGVDLFFLISGFIIYYITNNDNKGIESARIFFIKRFCRVFPPYFVITLFVAGSNINDLINTVKSLLFIPLNTENLVPWFGQAKLFVGWTLNYEFIFYTLYSLCMIFKEKKLMILSVIITLSVTIPAYINNVGIYPTNNYNYPGYLATMTNSLMFEFLLGCFAAYLVINKKIKYSKAISIALVTTSFIVFSYVILDHHSNIGEIGYILPTFMVLFTLTNHESLYFFRAPKPILETGKVSFSLYLVHFRAKSILNRIFNFNDEFSWMGIAMFALSVFLSFVLAFISYFLLEKKLSSKLKDYLLKKYKTEKHESVIN